MGDSKVYYGRIGALGRDNYHRWQVEITNALRSHGLWLYATGIETVVAEPADPNAGDYKAKMKAFLEFDKNDAKARNIIIATLNEETFNHVHDCVTSKKMLDRIRELRDPKTTDTLMSGIMAFFAETWRDDDSVASFMARLSVSAGKVNSCGDDVKMDDRFTIAKTLLALPPKFATFVQSWHLVAKDPKLSEFREKLLNAERGLQESDRFSEGSSGEALYAKSKDRMKAYDKSKLEGECFNCNKRGHRKADCPDLKRHVSKRKDSKREDDESKTGDSVLSVMTALTSQDTSSIIADSGASRHLTGNKSRGFEHFGSWISLWYSDQRTVTSQHLMSGTSTSKFRLMGTTGSRTHGAMCYSFRVSILLYSPRRGWKTKATDFVTRTGE